MKNTRFQILGVDLSINSTGICYRNKRGCYSFYETSFSSTTITADKWLATVKVVLDYAKDTDVILIEDYAHGSIGSSKSMLYELGGIIRYELVKADKKYLLVPPTSLKKFVTGKGNAPKSLILKEVYKRWNVDVDSDNIADAFGLVKLGEGCLGIIDLTKAQQDVILKLGFDVSEYIKE